MHLHLSDLLSPNWLFILSWLTPKPSENLYFLEWPVLFQFYPHQGWTAPKWVKLCEYLGCPEQSVQINNHFLPGYPTSRTVAQPQEKTDMFCLLLEMSSSGKAGSRNTYSCSSWCWKPTDSKCCPWWQSGDSVREDRIIFKETSKRVDIWG